MIPWKMTTLNVPKNEILTSNEVKKKQRRLWRPPRLQHDRGYEEYKGCRNSYGHEAELINEATLEAVMEASYGVCQCLTSELLIEIYEIVIPYLKSNKYAKGTQTPHQADSAPKILQVPILSLPLNPLNVPLTP